MRSFFPAEHVINRYYEAGFEPVEFFADLRALEESTSDTLWIVTTLECLMRIHDPDLTHYIRDEYRLVDVLPGSVGGADMRIYAR